MEDQKNKYYSPECPHCKELILIYEKEINCGIFRHGAYKDSMKPIPPHTSKKECEELLEKELVWGCAKPFRFDGKKIEKCDYI